MVCVDLSAVAVDRQKQECDLLVVLVEARSGSTRDHDELVQCMIMSLCQIRT